jgi:site-specific DNA-cytosine methylase
MADKDNKSKLTYHVWDKDNNEYDIPDEVVQQRGMDNFAKDFEGGYITMFDDKKQKVDVPIEDVGEYRKQGYIWYDTSGNATPINEVGKKTSPSSSQGKETSQYPQEVLDAFNSPDNKPGNFKDLAQLNDEYQRGELKKPSLISQALGMMPKVDAGNIGREQKMGGMITNMLLGDNMQQPQDNNQQVQHSNQENAPATEQPKPTVKDVDAITGAAPVQQVDAIYNKYVGKGDALSETMYDLMASGQAQNQEEAQSMAMGAMNRAANRLAQRTTDEFVSKLGDTVEGVDEAVMNGWHSHAVQDNLKKMASQYGIMNSVALDETGQYITQTHGYDQFINGIVKPAMVESLVKKYGKNYRKTAEDLATRLYSNDEVIQNQLMNQDIDEALSSVISKYVNPSVVEEYNKAQEEGSKAFNEGMEGSQNIPASLRLGTAIASQYEANQAKDPQKTLSALQKKFNGLYKNPQFLNDMSNAAFKVMQRYGMNGTLNGNPKQFKPMIDEVLKAQLNQLEVKNMIPKGSSEYIINTGLGNTIVGKITRKLVQTDYQNWLEDIANQQYQPGFWERVGSGALTFAGDAWSYWLPGAAGGKVTKSMLAKAEGRLASDLMAKGMEAKMAERAAKVLIGKSKGMALKTGAAHGAVTFGGQSAISKPIDEIYRTGQLDENGKVYNPSVGKILANTLGDVVKQSAVGAIMQGGTIANMVGKGRGLATNILADVGGKVADSGIMTGQQLLERMAHDPNFKPTGKDAAESFLESMANLTSIGLPGMVGKYARFKDAKEFNRKFDFNDQDIAELKRFGYDDLRDAFEKLGINGYRADGEGVQMMGQLTDKYMNLMNDKSVPEVLKAKMMAVVEGKRPSSFSPVIDSIIVQPMDNDGKVYLETLNKDGGIIDRKEYSSLEEAQKAEKKLDFEKSLNITSEYEKAYHTDALQDRLNTVYEQARDRYAAGEQLNDEDKAAIYLHQNASAIGDIMQKQQKGMELTEQEQQMVNSYRHFYDSAFENSPIMKEYVRTFEDSQGVEHGTLRKALEGDGKSRTAEQQKLVEEYQKQLYNDIVLKREMNDAKEQMNQNLIEGQRELPGATQEGGASAQNAEATAEKPVDASVSSDVPPTEPPTPPVGGETPSNVEGTPSVENGASPSDANTASNESKSNAYVMGQNAYQNGDAEGLKAIDHNDDVSKARLKRAFADNEAMMDVVVKAYEDGKDMEQFVAQRANSMTPAQQDAVRKYVEAQDAKKGVYDALQHADDGYGDALKELLWTYQTEDGNIVPATLTTGQQVFLKKANEYGGGFVVVPDEDGNPAIKQVSSAEIKEVGTPIPMDDYINQQVTEQKNARQQQFFAQYDGSGLKPSDTVEVAMEAGDEPMQMTFAGYSEDGKIVLSDGKDNIALTKDEFNTWRQNALDASIGAELDAEDAQRANDDAAKAEADKKQRYNEGIVGLGMGQPDYSSKDTEPKVAAEYLQEQFGNDHGKLMNLISGSRSDIKEQLDNKRKAASEYEDWLSLNADLDPEKAQKVENDLALVNEQIADLETRYKNWNAIRKEVMTPEEARTLKNERKAEIEKAGVDDSVGSPSDEREVAVLDNKELKKQYPTMDEASNYIASERKRIYHIQNDEVQPQIDGINEALEQYMNDDIDYSADQLKELNTTKAQLEARQANLSASAKDLKAQDKLLNTLYSAENKEERAKAMEEMTPSEQRKALVADALKKNDLGVIKEIYKDASVDVMDLTPQTLEEAVSESLSPHSLNPESLQYELGKSNFKFGIGKRYDSNKFNYLIAKKGTGMSVNEFAVRVFNDLPVNLQDMGYSDQDVRNTLLDMFKSYDNVKDMRNVALMNRIAAAEEELSAEEEWYEAQKEREIIERQAEIEEYNSYIQDKTLSLPSESELNAIEGMEYDRMLEAEEREREYKEYVKSILPEIADYDDRSNEEGYGGGGGLGSDSSRRGVDEGNSQGEEVGNGEASSESEIGEGSDSGRTGRQETGSMEPGEGSVVRGAHLPQEASFGERLKNAIAETEPNPSEAQKKAGNYKKGHLSFGGYDFTVETPKGATRSGKDEQGKPWSVTMHDTYGYILGKIGVDGDHIDMFINDAADLDSFDGNVYVVDQVNPETGEFDEHKVMFGYPSEEAATEAYLANYSKDWKGLGKVTAVPKATFDKWLESSDRKTKPFADYAMVQKEQRAAYKEEMMQDGAHSEAFDKIVELAKEQKQYWDLMEQGEVEPDDVPEVDVAYDMDELLKTLSDEEFKEVSDVLKGIDEEFEYFTADEYERREGTVERKKKADNAMTYDESIKEALKPVTPFATALKSAVESGDKKAIKKAQKELTDALIASDLGHDYLSGQLAQAKLAKKKDELYKVKRATVKPLTDALHAIENAENIENSDFISQMEYDYENDIHPSEEDKPKMQKFVERLLNFHSDKEDKTDSGYTILSSNIQGDKLYPNEKKWFGTGKYRKGVSWVDKQNNCAYEVNPRFNNRGYLSAVGVHKIVPLMKFDRDVKEVKPSEMTEAQTVAYDAVSTMLKKAGIPVKVVSNEDMEKVAEEQDNLNLAMLLNHPEMRFKIKTPEEKQAAENAYNFAKELRPNKWAQYAVVDMSNPNKMPEYYQKQELARKERTYLNKLMWGNYKVFNLNKSFEDNVAGLTGSFPSEFDPYKIDEQTNKRNELKKQIKETEDAYNSTGQERNNYQIQLMKEYMDEHGLASENDIPDDVWSKLNDKAHKKYQDKLDSLFAKYKDLDRQLKAIVQPGVRFLRTYHGTGASFDKFDFSHMGEGEGSQAFGWGGYVTNSKDIAEDYTRRAKIRKDNGGFEFVTDMSANNKDMVRQYIYKHKDVNKGLDAMRKDLSSALEMFPDDDDLKELSNILAKKNEEIAVPDNIAYLYDVDIPDDNGDYLDWDAPLTDKQKNTIIKELRRLKIDFADFKKRGFSFDGSFGGNAYDFLMYALRKTKKWKDVDASRAVSKFLSSIGFTGIKYKAGTIFGGAKEGDTNYVIFDENNAKIVDYTKFAQGKGVVYGYTDGKEIVLNQEHLNPNTPIHEYQHLWRTAAKKMNPELIEHGDKLIMQTQLFADLKEDPNYKHLSDDEICDEAFARLTGEDGAAILEQMAKDAIKENPLDTAKELTIINRLKNWLKKFWYWTLDTFTKWKPEDIKKMTLEDIRNLVLRDLAQGVDPRTVLKGQMTKDEAVSLRQQMADNAEPERILEHTENNWLQDFGKDGRVNTPIGSIKLGENQYKKAGREDRIKRFGLLKPTLERPDVILEKPAPKEGAERQTKYLFVKSFKKVDGTKILNFESITVKQGEDEVSISAHQIEPSKLLKELTESKMLWNRFRGDSNSLGENQGSALTPSANNPSGKDSVLNPHSDAKIRNSFEITKENGGNLSVEDKIKAVSQQFGVDEADVAMYANAIKKGSTAEAARARANIKRHLMQVNEGNIFSFKDVVKYTKPINEALKVNFGDLDAMIEERRKQVEAERNAMEAARKRAEEEEANRKKHLEELSLIPEDKLDKQYMDALAKGDDATAREMLDEVARRKGYDDTESAYQGVGAWAAPGNPGYESDKARRDDWESSGSDVNLEDMALGYTPQPDDYFSHPERYSQNTPHGLESVKAINTAIDAIKNGEKDIKVKVYRAVPTSVKEGKLRNGDWVTPSKKYAEMHGTNRLEGKYRIIEDEVPANQLWWDGNDANEFGFDDGKAYKYKNAKNNRKLNDLVTYDDEGDVIPPSKRFNSRKSDIRFMFAGEKGAAEADKAEEQTIRMDNLDVAKQMEEAKKDAKAIKMATGWEKGVDGKWRYEMPDAKIKDTIDVGGGNIVKRFEEDMLWTDGKLEDAVDAPKLFEAYPQLKNIKIHTDAVMNDMPSNGEYNPQTKTITIHADELKYLNSILNHEIQHVIQHEEGFAHGGTPEQVERDFKAAKAEWKARSYAFELEEKAKEMGGEYNQSAVEKALIQEYKDMDMPEFIPDKETRIKGFNYFARGYADRSMDDTIKRFRLDRFQRTDFDSYQEYRKLAGEVEARNVEKRLGMTDEERRNSLASETEDVNRDEQIVMNGNDASYSIVKDPETIKKLDKEDTVKVYRAMQVGEDGKLYPPMAAKVKGKFVEPIELGKWEQADERPELADDKGMFTLNKGNGKSLKAAYNPYLHTSRTPLNDQFSEAQNRPNIVTVEVEVPKSELTSGYKADKAKDAVGEVEWKAGIIQGQLTGKRKVVLSRWDKPVRIVPDSEVADVIVNDMFKGKNITMPSNVVTPSLRKELEKRGVPFVETDNRGRIVGGENDGVHYSKVYGKNAQSPILEQKLQKHPDSLMKAGTYFSGGGLVEEGLKGIIDPVVAVEYDRKISGVYRNNFGQHIVTADVRDVDPKELVKHIDGEVEYFHASPVCKNYSQAKSNGVEVELDKETAKSTADFIDAVKPRVVTIENVKGYKDSEAMKIITQALDKNGYKWDADVYNAADYGGYTSRERLIVRAVKDGELPEKPKKQPRKGGWLEAVEDILPTLTEKKSGVAPWMDARLKADGIDWQKVEKPLYVMGSAYADGKIPHAYGDEILPTLRTKSGDVIIMPGGKVLRADGRVLARITGLGDDYLLPKTESLAHTIIGNGIPVQLTKGVIAPLLNKDDLSGRNVLARLGSSIFKNNWDADKQKQVSDRVVNTANKLGGAEATVYTSVDEVPDAYLSDVKNGATGWYDPTTHTVHVYLPNCADADEAQRTVFHEKIGHEGMEVLLGGEQGVRKFADFVYKSVDKKTRGKILDFAYQYDPGWNNPDRINIGTQEYIAHLAEEGPTTAEDFSLWTKIKHYLIKVLKKLGIRVPGLLNDKDLRYYLMKAGKALHVWDNMPKEKQEAMMAQASNAEIKDALADGAGKGKPRQKKGESTIQYMKRVMEWKRWKEAREDKEDPEPPMFYDFDKDAEGKKEWERLNKEWRDSHGLRGEEMPLRPERKEGESDDAFMNRYKEWEKWNDAMGDKENPMPDMFSFEKQKQDEARQKYEDWLTRHELNEQNDADLDLYEGKIYPAETNPEADALEQEVMQDLAEVTSTDVSKEGAAITVKHAVIHRRKNMEEASADDAIYINDVKNSIEKMAESGAFDKLLSDYQGKPNKAEKLAEAIPYIIEAPRRIREIAYKLNSTGVFGEGHIHITPNDVEAIQELRPKLAEVTANTHTELKNGKEVELFDDMKGATEVASKVANIINGNHEKEPGFVPIDGTDILNKNVLPIILNRITPYGVDYKNLSEPMKSVLDSIRDWYNYTFDWLKDNNTLKADTGFTVDYVNHLWDKEKSDKNAYAMYVENRQRTKSPNEKPRQINTIMEGLEVGLVPKTTDITKMMAYYSRSNIEAWANKTMLQEVSGLNVIERNEDGEIISSDPLLSSVAPFNLEQYKYFEIPGVGPVWVYNVSPKQMKVKNPITGKDKVLYSEASAGDRFGVVFDTYQSTPFWKAFDTMASSMKKLELGFSGFHAGALTEVYMVQNMVEYGPKKALANFMKYIFVDTMKNHQLPCFANPQDFQEAATHLVKFGATNDYAAADVQNMFDNMRDAMMKVQEKLKDGNGISGTVAMATMPLKVATQMLSLINKGMDRALWDFLHDGLKLATYRMRADKTKERAKKKGWTEEELSRALDEDGQFVNDMFGGQHWDVLGASHRTLRYAGRVLLSPDWNASTTRHFLALTGYGSVWNEATLENFKEYYKRLYHKNLTPEDEGRRARQISSFLCYGLGFMVFYEAIANGINAAFRALDEEKERKRAEELRKTNPNYRSPYELAYPDGMKWFDYMMRGNSLGQQSKIFMGRYADGTEMYIRHGKQFREVPEYLFNHKGELEFPGPMVQRMIGKANPMVRMTLDDINYLSDFQASHADQEIQRKYGKTIGLLYKDALYWAPFLIPSQENKEFKAVDFFFPSSKGFSPWKAQSYFKDFILSGDMEGVVMTYQSCERNGIDPEEQIKAAIGSVKALESAEMKDGITSLQVASERFDEAKSITEKKKMRQKMKKFLSMSAYKAFTQKEALDMVQSYLNGEDDLKEMEKAENKYLMKAKSEDVTEDWRIQAVWNGTMETYDEYLRLKDVDKAKANAFKNSKTNKRLFAVRKAISAAKKKMNKAKKQMDGQNDAAKMVEIRKTRKELLETLNGME